MAAAPTAVARNGNVAPQPAARRPSFCAQLRATLRKTLRVKARQRLATLGEVLMPVQMIVWMFLMKMNLPDNTFPIAEFSPPVGINDTSPLACRFQQATPEQAGNCLNDDWFGAGSSKPLQLFYTPSSDLVDSLVNVTAVDQLRAAGFTGSLTARGFASAETMLAAVAAAPECSLPNQYAEPEALCFGIDLAMAGDGSLPDAVTYTLRGVEGVFPPTDGSSNAYAPSEGASCRPLYSSLDPPVAYPGGTETNLWGQSVLPTGCPSSGYLSGHFISVQLALDRAIAVAKLPEALQDGIGLQLDIEPLPRPLFIENFATSQSFFRVLLSFYIVLGMGQSVQVMVTNIVKEKEEHLREVRKTHLLRHFIPQTIILPRQAFTGQT
eukprot:COSAG06_NODE_5539_length_3417_cov_6.462327_2_plen_381_part_00